MCLKDENGFITSLYENEIIVFGSNLAGHHLGGAAKQAYEQFGAEWGVGEGLTGQSYAFPTLDVVFRKVGKESLRRSIKNLIACCLKNREKEFLLTRVGCGIAGFTDREMMDLFFEPILPKNLTLPKEWE